MRYPQRLTMQHGGPLTHVHANRSRFVSELMEFVRIPSVSAQPKHAGDVKDCAVWLANHLRRVGLHHVAIITTRGHPLVYADWLGFSDRPTLLIYGHYDVQPVDPLDEWQSPPFEPVIRDNYLYGRGASDDKSQMFALIKALEAYIQTGGMLPLNVKCLFEGEEEIGSPNLTSFIEAKRDSLSADAVVISDTRIAAPDRPAITYALRGALSLELEVIGPRHDLHSGTFSGAIHNPLQALCEILCSLHDRNGRVAIPGFYDTVRQPNVEEREYLRRTGPTDAEILHNGESARGWGESGFTLYERTVLRPALTVSGITGGYQGIIPARALAKLSFRLVPDQDPSQVDTLFRDHIVKVTPRTVHSVVRTSSGAKPVLMSVNHPANRAAMVAYYRGFGTWPVFLRSGGTIPEVNTFQETLSVPVVLMGFASPDDRAHAPNEKFHLPNFFNGIATCIAFLQELGTCHVDVLSSFPSKRDAEVGTIRRCQWLSKHVAVAERGP